MSLKLRSPMPDLSGATQWLRGAPITNDELKGHVTLVHFWAISCGICKPHLPTLLEWKKQYEPKGVRFVSVHMPRKEEDTNVADVEKAIEEYRVDHPTAVDNMHAVAEGFHNEYVPAYYVFDEQGQLRLYMSGEKVLPNVQATLDRLLTKSQEAAS